MPKKTEEQVITTKEKETILPASPEKLAVSYTHLTLPTKA